MDYEDHINKAEGAVDKIKQYVPFRDKERLDLALDSYKFFASLPESLTTVIQMQNELENIEKVVAENDLN